MFKVIAYRVNSSGEEQEIIINDVSNIKIEEAKVEKKKKYVFSVEKFKDDDFSKFFGSYVPECFRDLDGKEAIIKSNNIAIVDNVQVHPDWCIEVED